MGGNSFWSWNMGSLSKRSCMSKSIISAAVAALVVSAGAMTATTVLAGESKPTVSKPAQKDMKAAQDAMNAKNYTECVNKATTAMNAAGHTAFDTLDKIEIRNLRDAAANACRVALRAAAAAEWPARRRGEEAVGGIIDGDPGLAAMRLRQELAARRS